MLPIFLVAAAGCRSTPAQPARPEVAAPVVVANEAGATTDLASVATVVILDRSGSMQGMKLEAARDSAKAAAAALPEGAELAVIAFDAEDHARRDRDRDRAPS